MNTRQSQLLTSIIKEYIETAEPVGSSVLVSKYDMGVSPATVRNEMAVLEKEGYICQPHTSAGRVPTEKGYKYFVKNMSEEEEADDLEKSAVELLEQALRYTESQTERLKNLAKAVAEISGETILVGFSARELYYTGIANLFRKPEFRSYSVAVNIAEIIDEFDEAMEQFFAPRSGAQQTTSNPPKADVSEFFNSVLDEPKVLIGVDNPFSNECSAILTNIRIGETNSVFGLLGPMRMNYEQNLAMMKHVKKLLNSIL